MVRMDNLRFLVFLLVVVVNQTNASHFRGAIITWKPGSTEEEIIIDYRISWRMTFGRQFYCDDEIISQRSLVSGSGDIECFSGCGYYSSDLGSLSYTCTDFSVTEDWSSGRGRIVYTFPQQSSKVYEFGFRGTAWIPLNVGGGGNWRLTAKADLRVRPDKGRINSSPTAEISPIVRLQYGCRHVIKIPVQDPDDDVVRCFEAQGTNECGSICNGFPNSHLDTSTCTIDYDASHNIGWYAVALQVKDFASANSTTPLSSIPVQFLVNVYSSSEACGKTTVFVDPTPPEDACIGVPKNQIFTSALVARVANASKSISEIKAVSPLGLIKSGLKKVNGTDWRMNFTFAPRDAETDTIVNPFCFAAKETSGMESDKRCIRFLNGVSPPRFINGSQHPTGKVYSNQSQWSVRVDSDFVRTSRQAFVRLYDSKGSLLEKISALDMLSVTIYTVARTFRFSTSTSFREKEEYYFLFDFGILKGTTYCGAESTAIEDPNFWRIRIRDVTPPSINMTLKPSKTNSTAEFVWDANEPVNFICKLTNPYGAVKTLKCNNTWVGTDLQEGDYTFMIIATDLEGNSAFLEHRWSVDTTPPAISFLRTPSNISNEKLAIFKWACTNPCYTSCSVKALNLSVDCRGRELSLNVPEFSNRTYTLILEAADGVDNRAMVYYTWTTDFIPPELTFCGKGQSFTVNCTGDLSPEAVCNVTAADNMDLQPRLTYYDRNSGSCGISRTWTATDKAGNVNKTVQNIKVTSEKPMSLISPGPVSIACGALNNLTDILQSMFKVEQPCNLDVSITFKDNTSERCDTLIERNWTLSDNCGNGITVHQLLKIRQADEPLTPENGQTGVDLNAYLRWQESSSTILYEIYLWERDTARTKLPTAKTNNNYFKPVSLKSGTKYRWQVVFNYQNNETYLSPVWVFETRDFADLLVQNIIVPQTAFTDNFCTVEWTVVNIGRIATQRSYWIDAVFLSWDKTSQSAKLVATVSQRNILYQNDSYSSTARFLLEKESFGYAYIFIQTDYRGFLTELDTTNNVKRSTALIDVKLTPPPDLQVTSIRLPGGKRVFSGTFMYVTWTVVNDGKGPTKYGSWFDRILWSPTNTAGVKARVLSNVEHTGNLLTNESYTQTSRIHVPEFITGNYSLSIQVDAFNEVFEYLSENNTIKTPVYVTLTQPPDLEVETIYAPEKWETGDIVTVTWTVVNKGNDSPKSQMYWRDSAVLESTSGSHYIGSRLHFGGLIARGKYNFTLNYYVTPELRTAAYNVTVISDFWNNVFEFSNKANNKLSKTIIVTQALPNLKVQNFNIYPIYNPNKTIINVAWNVINIGKGKTLSTEWTDTLFVGKNDFYFMLKHFHVEERSQVPPGESYNRSETVELPYTIYGNLKFEMKVDDVYSSTGDIDIQNNVFVQSDVEIKLRAVDFGLDTIHNIKSIQSGEDIVVTYAVTNKGNLNAAGTKWHDRIYVTDSSNNDYVIHDLDIRFEVDLNLKQDNSYNNTVKFTIPVEMSGTFYVVVRVNFRDDIFEGDKKSNNKGVKMVTVESAPAADLTVKSLAANISITTNNILSVEWSVENIGNSMQKVMTWHDTVMLKRGINAESLYTPISFRIEHNLEAYSSYTQLRKMVLPSYISGTIYVCAKTNSFQTFYEPGSEENNILCQKQPICIRKLTAAKLSAKVSKIISKSESELFIPGSSILAEFTVENVGELPTELSSWTDSIYISDFKPNNIAELRKRGTRVQDVIHLGLLGPNESYFTNTTFIFPVSYESNPVISVLANDTEPNASTLDVIVQNGTTTKSPETGHPAELGSYQGQINFSFMLPNLCIESNATVNDAQGGEPIQFQYVLLNAGNVSTNHFWYDSAYLSHDIILDAFDPQLASVLRSHQIDAGKTLTVNISFILPLDIDTKSYYLTIVADSRHDIFESDENDNSFRRVVYLKGRASTDIAVSDVDAPKYMDYGKDVNISWSVRNKGLREARGFKCDSVYLSEDRIWDMNDAQVGRSVCSYFHLAANSTAFINGTLRSNMPDVASSLYSTIVKSRSNLLDLNLDNNIASSRNTSKVVYTTISVDTPTTTRLIPYGSIVLQIVNVSNEETLIFNISSNNRKSFNSLYVKGGRPATLYEFDKSSDNPNMPDQILSVPDTIYSEYYVLIVNTGSSSSFNIQNITLNVRYAQFEVFDVYPMYLIGGAQTTFHITGTMIPYDAHILLRSANVTYEAIKTLIFSSVSAYATFYIDDTTSLSRYSMVLMSYSLNETIEFSEYISAEKGINGYLVYSVQAPSRLRNGETGTISINIQNGGDSDIHVPLIVIEASDQGSVRLIDNTKIHVFQQKYFVFGSPENGIAGILPPKARCQLKFETKQNETYLSGQIEMTLNTFAMRQNRDTQNPFIHMKESLRPSHYDTNAWTPIWNNFIAATGNTSLSISKKFSDVLNEMSLGGRYVKNVDDIVKYLLEVADAPYAERILIRYPDLQAPSDLEVTLTIERYLSARIGSRSQVSYLGKGWILPLWDTQLKRISEDVVTLTIEKVDFNFIKISDNAFIHTKLGVISIGNAELIYLPSNQRKKFHFDRDTLVLTEISSLVDDSYLKMEYMGNLLMKIYHSSGAFVTVKYDRHSRIEIMQLQNSSTPADNTKMLCVYDFDTGMLSEVRLNGESIRYAYFQNAALKYILNPDKSMILYEYSTIGHLTAKKLIRNRKEVTSQRYSYSSGGVVSVERRPENKAYNLTFNENGDVIFLQRKGFLPEKTVTTTSTEIQYDGDMIVTKRVRSGNGDTLFIEDGNGDSLQPTFNNRSQLIGFKDGTGNEYKIKINSNGSMHGIAFPDGSKKSYIYTQNGHTVVTQNNGTKEFVYNGKRQLIMKIIGNNSTYTYNYDENGKLINGANDNGIISLSYSKDKVETIAYNDVLLDYTYNEMGLVSSLSTNNGYFVNYKYNDLNKLELVTDKGGRYILRAEYDAAGKIIKKLLGNNATTTYSYDSITGLLKNMTNYFPNGSVASYFRYKYSRHLRRITVDTHEGVWKFKYDRSGQVISMTNPKNSVTKYGYDNSKNRVTVSVDGVAYETKVNSMNQYERYGERSYLYDKNGNMNFRKDDSTDEFFSFDEDNKLVSYKSKISDCVFGYDALDNLYSKTCNDVTTRYIVNPRGNFGSDIIGQVIRRKDGQKKTVHYYHGGNEIGLIAARYGDGNMNYFMYDPIGTVQGILNEKGDLLNSFSSDPFGQVIHSSETSKSLFTFVGQWGVVDFEEIPGVYFMRSRLYDSYTGRFLSIDAYGLKAHSKNLYAYCANNPVHCNDPNGKFWTILAGSAIGVLDYVLSTPYEERSWGGAAGAAFSGAIAGTGFGGVIIATAADLGAGWIARKIDHQPYSLKDFYDDFTTSLVGQAESKLLGLPGRILKRLFQGSCQAFRFTTHTQPKICGIPKELLHQLGQDLTRWVISKDPNDIIGPSGFGAAKFINKISRLTYKIRFENDENATAPAQKVYIEHTYSQYLDPRSFMLGEFGFGNFTRKVNSKVLQDKINLTAENGIFLRVFAGLDLAKEMIFWEFQSLDPATGEAPVDPGIGFLPPNNGTSGQGYVTFSIQPKEDAQHLSTIHANASIFFDQNDPIDTPNIFNTIDDSSPNVTGAVIKETESSDSVTLLFEAVDSGSGVKYIDLFQDLDNGYSIFRPGLTETTFVMPLQPGESYTLLAVGIDHVGNRLDMKTVSSSNIINVTSPNQIVECKCSGNGNCSSGSHLCNCLDGFYGSHCNSTVPPPEPPVLELKSQVGFVNQPIELTISARNLSGSLEKMEIFVSGFQNGTEFSAGTLLTNDILHLSYKEFGKLNMTIQEPGQIKLSIYVVQTSEERNYTRSGVLLINVFDNIDGVNITLQGCFAAQNGLTVVLLNLTVAFDNETLINSNYSSSITPHKTLLSLPSWLHPVGEELEATRGVYTVGDTLLNTMLSTSNRLEPFMLSVDVHAEYSGFPASASKEFQIKSFCGGECGHHDYGVSCDQPCPCNWQNAVGCDKFTGSCTCKPQWEGAACNDSVCHCILKNMAKCEPVSETCFCKPGWTGSKCEADVDECLNETICHVAMTTCVNRDGGYDCVCPVGYDIKDDKCVECEEGRYGYKCEGNCNCTWNNTDECEKINGTCICQEEWSGETCDTDINECENTTKCVANPHTVCQNKIPGYDCLCRLGYKQEDSPCVEIKEPEENKTVSTTHDERETHITVHVGILVPNTDNLEVEATYRKYKIQAIKMLTDFYRKELGDGFIRVIVQRISLGSLVIEHDVITKDTEEVSENLAFVVVNMKLRKDNTLMAFNGQNVSVESVSMNETEVTDICEVFKSLSPCNTYCKRDTQDKHTCRKLTPPAENQKDDTILIISLSAGISVTVLAIALIVVACVWKNRKKTPKKIHEDDVQFRRKSHVYEHPNPGYDDTEADDDDAQSLTSSTINRRHDYLNQWKEENQFDSSSWQANPYYEHYGSSSSLQGSYCPKQNAYVYRGRNKNFP